MFSHIVVGANDIPAAKTFYDAVLGALGHAPGAGAETHVIYSTGAGSLLVMRPRDGNPATVGNGVTVGFTAPGPEAVDAFHAAGLANGGTDEGAPGPRDAIPNSYAAYVRDPVGNKLVAWCIKAA